MNSFQQPNDNEPGGATWHKVADPATGWLASKTSGWTADSFSGGLTVDFSAVVPAGTRAVRAVIAKSVAAGTIYWRPGGDVAISNTPHASGEKSHIAIATDTADEYLPVVLWLSETYTVDLAVNQDTIDVYVSYPSEYLL